MDSGIHRAIILTYIRYVKSLFIKSVFYSDFLLADFYINPSCYLQHFRHVDTVLINKRALFSKIL